MSAFDKFIAKLEEVAILGEEVSKLKTNTSKQEAEALALIIEKVKQVMRYIDYSIPVNAYRSGYQFDDWKYDYLDEYGVILVNNFKKECTYKNLRGEYTGSQLVLTRSGKLIHLTRTGEWSRFQDEESEWTARTIEMTAEDAVREYDFADIVSGLVDVFTEAISDAKKEREALKERLTLLEQVKEMLAG